jgi:hypothetical protein
MRRSERRGTLAIVAKAKPKSKGPAKSHPGERPDLRVKELVFRVPLRPLPTSASSRANVDRINLMVWLQSCDVTDHETIVRLSSMVRSAEGVGDATKDQVIALLDKIGENAAHLDDIGAQRLHAYTRLALQPAHTDLALRLTEDVCAKIARALVKRGRKKAGALSKYQEIDAALRLIGIHVSESTIETYAKIARKK